jgi:hypothetical protein
MRRSLAITTALTLTSAMALGACGGGDSYSKEKFCAAAEDTDEAGDDVDGALDDGDPKKLEREITNALEAAEATVKLAPKDIKADMEVVVDKQTEFVKLLEDVDYDLLELDEKDMEDFLDDRDFDDASENIDDFLLDECDIEPDDEAAAPAPVDPAPTDETVAVDPGAGVPVTVDPATAALIPDFETFVEFAALGNNTTITEEQTACVAGELKSRLTLEELQLFVDLPTDQIPEDKTVAVGLSFINCGVDFEE